MLEQGTPYTLWKPGSGWEPDRLGAGYERLVDAVREADRYARVGVACYVTDSHRNTRYRNTLCPR